MKRIVQQIGGMTEKPREMVEVELLRDCRGHIAGEIISMSPTDAAIGAVAGFCRIRDADVAKRMRSNDAPGLLCWR
jgi:hypothetical protein